MYSYVLRKSVDKSFFKLAKKDPAQLSTIEKKINEIIQNPQHYKNLRSPLQHLKRVHIGSFVITFSVDETTKKIIFEDFDHHDSIYK